MVSNNRTLSSQCTGCDHLSTLYYRVQWARDTADQCCKRLIGEVVQPRRRPLLGPLLGPSPWLYNFTDKSICGTITNTFSHTLPPSPRRVWQHPATIYSRSSANKATVRSGVTRTNKTLCLFSVRNIHLNCLQVAKYLDINLLPTHHHHHPTLAPLHWAGMGWGLSRL